MDIKMTSEEARKRMEEGRLYLPSDEDIVKEQTACLEKLYDFNNTRPSEYAKRMEMLKDMFAEFGTNNYIEPPFHSNFGGAHVHFGSNIYANFNLTMVDDGHIYVEDNVMFGPNVTVCTATHPVEPHMRKRAVQFNLDIKIKKNAWIGAGSVIMPGITIGENSVVGAGSIVTKDVPDNVVVVGNPARILRKIGDHDREYYYKNRKVDLEIPND